MDVLDNKSPDIKVSIISYSHTTNAVTECSIILAHGI